MGKHDRKREGALSRTPKNEPSKANQQSEKLEFSPSAKLRRAILIIVSVVGLGMAILPWTCPYTANSFLSIATAVLPVSSSAFMFLMGKQKSPKTSYWVKLLFVAVCFLFALNSGLAQARFQHLVETKELQGESDTSGGDSGETFGEKGVQEIPDVELDEDFLMAYSNVGNDREMAKQIARKFVEKYRDGNLPYPRKPAEELRGGDYGDHMDAANKDHKVVDLDTEPDVKLNAVKSEIEERETADEISAEPDNLVLLGDLYLMRLDLESLDPDERIKVYHDAIRCYWKALQVWNSEGPGPYSDGWNRIYEAYDKMGQDPIIESPHQKRAEWLAKIFKEILQEERERASIFSNSK